MSDAAVGPHWSSPRKQVRGCFFWGCMISGVLALVLIGGAIALTFYGYTYLVRTAKEFTETASVTLPAAALPAEERKALHERVDSFGEAVRAEKPAEPIVLTADDLNALIDDNPKLKGKAHVAIEGEKIKAEVSIPLDDLNVKQFSKDLSGRYLNGTATLRVSLRDGALDVRATDIRAKGKPLPDAIARVFEGQNLAEGASNDPQARASIGKLQSVEVKGGKIILTPRTAPEKPKS